MFIVYMVLFVEDHSGQLYLTNDILLKGNLDEPKHLYIRNYVQNYDLPDYQKIKDFSSQIGM